MANFSWRVDSYHINVGNGDGSVHVLVYLPQSVPYKCVMFDGGSAMLSLDPNTGSSSQAPFENTLAYLDKAYSWENGRCQLDSMVITHWDEDHYANMLNVIQKRAAKDGGIVSFLRYKPDKTPATVLYAPNWSKGPDLNGAFAAVGNINGYACINTSYKRGAKTDKDNWVPFAIPRFAESDMRGVLGAELFSNTVISGAVSLADVTDITKLALVNPPGSVDKVPMPALYCVCVWRTVLGPPAVEVIKERVTMTNQVSIICVLYWTDTGRISLYLGGDAEQDTESKFLRWLTRGGMYKTPITSVKLSHHGSRSSTPLQFLQTVTPKNIVMSIPSAKHCHPCE